MKKVIKCIVASFMLLLVGFNTQAQSAAMTSIKDGGKMPNKLDTTQVPIEIRNMYIVEYPTVTAYDWYGYPTLSEEREWHGYDRSMYTGKDATPEYYIVEFNKEAASHRAIYSKKGGKVALHRNLKKAAVPELVKKAYDNGKYKSWNVVGDYIEVLNYSNNSKVYMINIEKGKEAHTIFYDEKGKLLKDKTTKM